MDVSLFFMLFSSVHISYGQRYRAALNEGTRGNQPNKQMNSVDEIGLYNGM